MDPITTAIVTALAAGALAGTTDVSKQALVDAYTKLKTTLLERFGNESEPVTALARLEAKPDSEGRKTSLSEELLTVRAEQDPTLQQLAQAILDQVQAQPNGAQIIQQHAGSHSALATHGGTASVTITTRSDDDG